MVACVATFDLPHVALLDVDGSGLPTVAEYKQAQLLDPECKRITANLTSGDKITLQKFCLGVDGILVLIKTQRENPTLLTVVPESLWSRTILSVHEVASHVLRTTLHRTLRSTG